MVPQNLIVQIDTPKVAEIKKLVKGNAKNSSAASKNKIVFAVDIFRILKKNRTDLSISKEGVVLLNQLLTQSIEELMNEAKTLVLFRKKKTMGIMDLEIAVKIFLHGELRKQALSNAAQQQLKYAGSRKM